MARVLLALGVLVGTTIAPSSAVPAVSSASSASSASSHHEGDFVARLNGMRAEHGLHSLEVHSGLVAMARRWAATMATDDDISHNPNLAAEAPQGWVRLGENVGVGATVEKIHEAFAASASHRKNLLQSDFTYVGVGVVTGRDGALFVTQNFMRLAEQPPPPPEPEPAPPPTPVPAPPDPPPPRVRYVLEFLAAWDRQLNLRQ